MADALDNLIGSVHLLRTEGGVRLTNPRGLPILIPTPCTPRDVVTLFAFLAEGWRIETERDTETQELPPTMAPPRRSTTRRRRRR